MTTILVQAGEHSQTLFIDPARVDELANGSAAAIGLPCASQGHGMRHAREHVPPMGNPMAAALDLLSAYAASQPGEDTSAAQELVAAVCLWVLKKSMPHGQFEQAKTALKMPGFALCLTITGSGLDAGVAFEIVTRTPQGTAH